MPSLSSRLYSMSSKKLTILNTGWYSPHCTSQRHAHKAFSLKPCRRPFLPESLNKKTARYYEYHIRSNSQIGRREKCWHLFLSSICYEQRRSLHLENIKCNAAPIASSSVQETTTTSTTHRSKEEKETEFSMQSESFAFDYSPPPPRPASYVPPDKRDANDPSLDYLSSDNPLHKIIKEKREFQKKSFSASPSVNLSDSLSEHMNENNSEIVLEEGQMLAPSPKPPTRPTVHYIDRHAERLHSTSVRGGHSLLDRHTGIDTGELYFARNDEYSNTSNRNEESLYETTSSLTTAKPYVNDDKSFHTHNFRKDDDIDNITTNINRNRNSNIDKIEESTATKKYDVNGAVADNLQQNATHAHKNVEANHVYPLSTKTKPEVPDIDAVTFFGLEEDKISWYQPIFDSQSQTYKSNAHGTVYGRGDMYDGKPLELSMQEQERTTSKINVANDIYSQNIIKSDTNKLEREQSLEDGEESIHVQRQREMQNRRMRWQNRLFSYSPEKAPVLPSSARHVPATLVHEKTLEENRNKELRGYAFPPSSELANLKSSDRMQWLYALEKTRHEKTLFDKMRQTYDKLRGKSHDQDEYVVTEGANLVEDTSLWYRYFNIDAIQRRQLRYMFTDNDYGNMTTALHVMHTYSYTNILYVIIVMLSIWLLYKLQLYFNALEFYDEYLGIDLTLTPDLKKPLLGIMAFIVGVFYLSYPTCLLSIGITRAYRILLRRPIGPP